MTKRKTAVPSAQCWYDDAHSSDYTWHNRVIMMENAFNHTENALIAARDEIEKQRKALAWAAGFIQHRPIDRSPHADTFYNSLYTAKGDKRS